MKGLLTLQVEIDYATMLGAENQGAVYLFTGAKSVEEMIKVHMDQLSAELVAVLKDKPLVLYNLDGRLRRDVPPDVPELPQETMALEAPTTEQVVQPEQGMEAALLPEPQTETQQAVTEEPSVDHVALLNKDIDQVSMELGIPQVIKVNEMMLTAIESTVENEPETGITYRGFPIEVEGMDVPYIIVYKSYNGSEIKLLEANKIYS